MWICLYLSLSISLSLFLSFFSLSLSHFFNTSLSLAQTGHILLLLCSNKPDLVSSPEVISTYAHLFPNKTLIQNNFCFPFKGCLSSSLQYRIAPLSKALLQSFQLEVKSFVNLSFERCCKSRLLLVFDVLTRPLIKSVINLDF